MYQDDLQRQAHEGSQEAFRELYSMYSRKVYSLVRNALDDSNAARDAVKQIFLRLYREIVRGENDLDIPAELSALTNEEIRLRRIANGDLSENALQVQYIVSADEDLSTNDTMVKIRARILENDRRKAVPEKEEGREPDEEKPRALPEERRMRERKPERTRRPEREEEPEEIDPEDLLPQKKRGGSVFAGILMGVLIAIFLWLLAGILMDLGYIPFADLGYSFFNKHVFELFRLQ